MLMILDIGPVNPLQSAANIDVAHFEFEESLMFLSGDSFRAPVNHPSEIGARRQAGAGHKPEPLQVASCRLLVPSPNAELRTFNPEPSSVEPMEGRL
jgi:hypothetical protein